MRPCKKIVTHDDLPDVMVDHGAAVALWCRVLEQAFDDLKITTRALKRPNTVGRRRIEGNIRMINAKTLYIATKQWFFESEKTGTGSLMWLCEHLDMDISEMRKAARRIIGGRDERD